MHFATDLSTALQNIEAVKAVIDASDDAKLQLNTADNLKLIIGLLQDPVLRSIVQVQDSLSDLNKQIVQHPSMLPSDFDINLSGDLVLNVPSSPDMFDGDYAADEQRVPSAQLSPVRNATASSPTMSQQQQQQQHHQHQQQQHQHKPDDLMLAAQRGNGIAAGVGLYASDHAAEPGKLEKHSASSGSAAGVALQPPDLMAAEWALIQSLELVNDGTGLGFGIIGARTAGVIVKTIMPGGVADRDGRLLSGDHILRIGDVDLHDMGSEQVASVLRQSGTHVRLVVARSLEAGHGAPAETEGCFVVPGRLLSQPRELDRYMVAAGYSDMLPDAASGSSTSGSSPLLPTSSPPPPPTSATTVVHHAEDFSFHEITQQQQQPSAAAAASSIVVGTMPTAASIASRPMMLPPHELELPETDRFIVELTKDANGLGITIAGYVCEKEELSGIFVKSVSPGSAADLSGRIQVNDRIIEVDQQPLQGYSNHQAVEVLKKSGSVVRLCLERYLRGPKFEQLQQAIAANESTAASNASAAATGTMGKSSAAGAAMPRPPSSQSMHREGAATVKTPSLMRRPSFGSDAAQSSTAAGPTATGQIARKLLTNARDSLETRTTSLAASDEFGHSVDSSIVDEATSSALPHIGHHTPVAHVAPSASPLSLHHHHHHHHHHAQQQQQQTPAAAAVAPTAATQTPRHKYWVEPVLTPEIEDAIRQHWRTVMPPDTRIIVAQIRKFAASSGLGISLEGTVDVEGGMEVRPHHYIRSILPEGPVGQNGQLRSSDELLEVNNQRLLGMNHLEVVSILKELPQDVRMVCARSRNPADQMVPFTEENLRKSIAAGCNFGGSQNLAEKMAAASDRLVKAKSDGSLATSGGSADDSFCKLKSRSLEPLTGLAMWSSEPQIIELVKGDRGLGFSILDYQDPLDANDTLIVIRSLVPGGVAQLDGRLIPGDRLLFVNDINLENSSLDQAVQALKGAPRGIVRIGVAKPLPMAENSLNLSGNPSESANVSAAHTTANNSGSGIDDDTTTSSLSMRTVRAQHALSGGAGGAGEPDVIPDWMSK